MLGPAHAQQRQRACHHVSVVPVASTSLPEANSAPSRQTTDSAVADEVSLHRGLCAQAVLHKCLKLDPKERASAESVHAALLAVREGASRAGQRLAGPGRQADVLYEPGPSCCTIM